MTYHRIVVHNPVAGSVWREGRMRRVLEMFAHVPGTLIVATQLTGVAAQVRALLHDGVTAAFACGGDGTVADVAAGVSGTRVALGIVPCGTTNTLANDFGIPANPLRAVPRLLASAVTREMQTWSVGEHRLVLSVGVGWDGELMWRTPRALKRRLGYAALTPVGIALAARYGFPELLVTGTAADGTPRSARGTSVLVANSRFWAGSRAVFPDADPSSGTLQVVVLERASLAQLVPFWLNMQLPGAPLRVPGVRVLTMRRIEIRATGAAPVDAHVNGDPVAHTPLVIEPSDPVQVLLPAPAH